MRSKQWTCLAWYLWLCELIRIQMSARKPEIQICSLNQVYVFQPRAWKHFTSFKAASLDPVQRCMHTHRHSRVQEIQWGTPATGDTGTQDTWPLLTLHPSPIPAVLANALRDLSHDNEKLKCDGFNYNLYFHLTINYLPVIGGTSLSHDTRSGEKGSQGKEPVTGPGRSEQGC